MKALLFGATGMVGQGVLRECLLDPAVTKVVAVGRHPTGQKHAKLSEVALVSLPFRAAYMFRPGAIIPLHGIRSRTRWYNAMYMVLRPLFAVFGRFAPTMIITTEQMGGAMIAVARNGYATKILEMADINRLSAGKR